MEFESKRIAGKNHSNPAVHYAEYPAAKWCSGGYREILKLNLVEYEKAADPAGPPSPLLLARKATCYEALGGRARALALVDEGVALYPEFTLLQVTRGRLLDAAGRTEEAVVAWSAAHDLNPYDPAVQAALVRGYEAIGDAAAAARHAGYARILATGGARP